MLRCKSFLRGLALPIAFLSAASAWGQSVSGTSCLEVFDLGSGTHTVIREFPFLIEAPNWSPDGKWLLVNKEGRLYRIAPDGQGSFNVNPWNPESTKFAFVSYRLP